MMRYVNLLLSYKQSIMWKMWCNLLSNLEGCWWVMRREEGSFGDSSLFFFLLSWKNCCITSAHSVANTPLLIFIFGWNGWTGGAGLSLASDTFSPPSGKSLQNNLVIINNITIIVQEIFQNKDSIRAKVFNVL